jgi:hypothetical protein
VLCVLCVSNVQAPWTLAYHGLARAFIRSTEDSATPAPHRRRLREIDAEASPNVRVVLREHEGDFAGNKGDVAAPAGRDYSPLDIVVEATVVLDDGSTAVGQATVPVSADLRWAPREVASRSALGLD